MRFKARRRKEPQVVLVSLVDVVLQLVIFFVLTSTFGSGEVAMDIVLPEAQAPAGTRDGVTVDLDEDGTLKLDGKEVTRQALADYFREETENGRNPAVVLRADRDTRHGEVVAVLDLAMAHRMRQLSITAVGTSVKSER